MTLTPPTYRRTFEELARARGDLLVTLQLPTERAGPQTLQGPVRLRNLVREARERAQARGLDAEAVGRVLAPVDALIDDDEFWQHQADGLALFANDEGVHIEQVAVPLPELVVLSDRFDVRGLLLAVSEGHVFHILALSRQRVRLLAASRMAAREVDLAGDAPTSVAESHGRDRRLGGLQFHTSTPRSSGGQRAAIFHGHGGGKDDDAELPRFLKMVDAGVLAALGDLRQAPLVLAGTEEIVSAYGKLSDHPNLVDATLQGNFDHADDETLHAGALPLVDAALETRRSAWLQRVLDAAHTSLVECDLARLLDAARQGRVDVLLVDPSRAVWGAREAVDEGHDERRVGDDDLLGLAVSSACRTGAKVYPASASELPTESPVAALLRG